MKLTRVVGLVVLLSGIPAYAQEQTTLEKTADWTSTGLVGVNLVGEAIYDARHHCLKGFLLKNGLSILSAEGLKLLIHEERPDHSDKKSWPSEHSWLSSMNTGWNYKVAWTISFGAGAGRVVANKHWPWDVASGLLIGGLIEHYFPCEG